MHEKGIGQGHGHSHGPDHELRTLKRTLPRPRVRSHTFKEHGQYKDMIGVKVNLAYQSLLQPIFKL